MHATGGNLRVWDPVVGRLAARRTVVAVDLPGFGLTPAVRSGVPPTLVNFARVLAEEVRQLRYDSAT